MKAREERRKTLIRARMRFGSAWSDVAILNLSLHGAGLQSADPPARGTYVELRRGGHVIIARVAWSDGRRFGIRSQDPLAVDAIISEPSATDSAAPANVPRPERRAVPRTAASLERSRNLGRAAEFACLVMLGGAAGVGLYGMVEQALTEPLGQISLAMDPAR